MPTYIGFAEPPKQLKMVVPAKNNVPELAFAAAYVYEWLDFEAAAKLARQMDQEAADNLAVSATS